MHGHAYSEHQLYSLSDRRRSIKQGETTAASHVLYDIVYVASVIAYPLTHHVIPHRLLLV
jgi:hypothetical protein